MVNTFLFSLCLVVLILIWTKNSLIFRQRPFFFFGFHLILVRKKGATNQTPPRVPMPPFLATPLKLCNILHLCNSKLPDFICSLILFLHWQLYPVRQEQIRPGSIPVAADATSTHAFSWKCGDSSSRLRRHDLQSSITFFILQVIFQDAIQVSSNLNQLCSWDDKKVVFYDYPDCMMWV